jgi:hypothetical protein
MMRNLAYAMLLWLILMAAFTVFVRWQGIRSIPTTHVTFHNALCACPVCLVNDSFVEASWGEYC